ncbi:MAG: hypothetical protein ABI718_13575 [Acidobacteriota bacterium]
MIFESRFRPLLPMRLFLRRQAIHVAGAVAFILLFLLAGMTGYHVIAGFSWIDSFLNAAMILGGMGPVDPLTSSGSKLFAGLYALVSGVVFLVVVGVMVAPTAHRLLHTFHIEEGAGSRKRKKS